jgi:uncharacterized protein (TIGR03435 family)
MNTLFNNPAVQALGWALLHFVWQGALLAVTLFLANLITKSARIRYAAGCAVMFLMPAVFLATVLRSEQSAQSVPYTSITAPEPLYISSATSPAGRAALAASSPDAAYTYNLSTIPGWIACLWLVGVAALSIFTAAGWLRIQQLTNRDTTPVDPIWLEAMESLKRRLKISKPVRLCTSTIAEVPTVIGWLRPYILLPVSALAGLDESQLRAILAHELAHIRRHDYLINLLQNAIETLLFYHPAVWWVSRQIRQEREHCCDDLAVEVCGDVILYASALTQLEQLRGHNSEPALAATGGDLLARIRRLTGPRNDTSRITGSIAALTTAALVILTLVGIGHAPAIHAQSPVPHSAPPVQLAQAPPSPIPAPKSPAPAKSKFDVASIRPCSPTDAPANGGRSGRGGAGSSDFETSPGRISVTCMTVAQLMNYGYIAYGIDPPLNDNKPFDAGQRFRDGPAWVYSDRYTIEAKTSDSEAQGVTGRSTKADKILMAMLWSLLEDRFQLKIHSALEEVPAYDLTVAKGGLKLKPMEPGSCVEIAITDRPGSEAAPDGKPWCRNHVGWDGPNWTLEARGQSLSRIAQTLGGIIMDRPVVDKTGIPALFTFTLTFAHDESAPGNFPPGLGSPFPPTDVPAGESVFTALEKLGLKLVPSKAPHGYTVIDHIERPSEN